MTRGLDHVVLVVRDLEAVRDEFAALGFTTTPKAMHPWGTANSLVQLDRSFIEILAVDRPQAITPAGEGEFSFGDFNRRFLARREGMSMLVFSSADARADRERWLAEGLDTYAPFDFSRAATLPSGEQARVAFSLAFVTDPGMPWAAWFVCQQHHPEHFWKPEYQRHGNGASALECVWLQAEQPGRHREFLARLFAEGRVADGDDGAIVLTLDFGRVEVRTPADLARRFGAAALPPVTDGPAFAAVSVRSRSAGTRQVARVGGLVVEIV